MNYDFDSETYEFRVLVTTNVIEQQLANKGSCWYPHNDAVSFTYGILSNVSNHFQLRILPGMKGVEVYHPKHLMPRYCEQYQPKISYIELKILYGTNAHRGETLSHKELNEVITSPTGHQSDYCWYSIEAASFRNRLPSSMNGIQVLIHASQELKPEVRQYRIPQFNYIPEANKKRKLFDLTKYFLSSELLDVTIRCEAETFPAHIFVLGANSPVFAKMFEHDLKESKDHIVEIKDVNSQVVRELLRYFYCGQVENFEDVGPSLYELGDRYMVDNLKNHCVESFIESVNKENALELYVFGKMKEISNLVEKAEPFVTGSKSELIKTNADLQALLNALPPAVTEEVYKLLVHK